eukprot:8732761-Pyramimonas_sp.AAC.1
MPQGAPKRHPRGPERPPRGPQEIPRGPKTAPKRFRNCLQEAPEKPPTQEIPANTARASCPQPGRGGGICRKHVDAETCICQLAGRFGPRTARGVRRDG